MPKVGKKKYPYTAKGKAAAKKAAKRKGVKVKKATEMVQFLKILLWLPLLWARPLIDMFTLTYGSKKGGPPKRGKYGN